MKGVLIINFSFKEELLVEQPKLCVLTTMKFCNGNAYLTSQAYLYFLRNGYEFVKEPKDADYVIINTCVFDSAREKIARDTIDSILMNSPKLKKLIIIGCFATAYKNDYQNNERVIKIAIKESYRIDEMFKRNVAFDNVLVGTPLHDFMDEEFGFADHYYLKISDGCINNCSYCIIKKAKGFVYSKPIDAAMKELNDVLNKGIKKILLLSDDCASYGKDIGVDFADLLNEIMSFKSSYEFELSFNYFHPTNFLNLYSKINKDIFSNITSLNIPIQTTSKRILKLMNRNYDPEEVFKKMMEIKKINPSIYLITHILYSFPSETREEIKDTFRAKDYFDRVMYFCYADKEGTKSAKLENKISKEEKVFRSQMVLDKDKKHDNIVLAYHFKPNASLAEIVGIE
ncbi:ribosomal protein S12 methylthiotransferase RimO [Candidatus Magnetomorum sp. HK-1]|nr:ribosomal protein S12 methylthiotransferase RimO [Candidatus Magnetomorum sp. HK-1]